MSENAAEGAAVVLDEKGKKGTRGPNRQWQSLGRFQTLEAAIKFIQERTRSIHSVDCSIPRSTRSVVG